MHDAGGYSNGSSVWPKISIVTPSYNQGKYLEKTIESVLSQGYPNLEYIIIDGGSTDNSVQIIKRFESRLSFWESASDEGQSHALNKGFRRAKGGLIGWLNSDDWYAPGALQAVAEKYQELDRGVFGAIIGDGDLVNERGEMLFKPSLTEVNFESLYQWKENAGFMQPSCFFTREAWECCGPLNESLEFTMDLDFWLKIRKDYSFCVISELLSHSLAHSTAKTTSHFGLEEAANQSPSIAVDIELALVIASHGGLAQSKQILGVHLENFIELRKQVIALEGSKSFKLVQSIRRLKEVLRRSGG